MKNIIKNGFYILAVLALGMTTSCDDDDTVLAEISGLDFVVATLNLEGTEIGVVPTTVNNNNTIVYTVDYGTDADDDVFQTSGPMVTYEYPNEDGTYSITVTANLEGASPVSITKVVDITEYIPPTTGPSTNSIVGSWKLAPQAAALGVGPGLNDFGWWSNAIEDVETRSCLFDDLYVFNEDGTFENVLGAETWVEPWQGAAAEECGAPVFPHDGTATATYTFNEAAGTLTLDGKGAFLGLSKVINGAEMASPSEAPDSITYLAELSEDGNTLEIDIAIAGDGYWSFTLVRDVPSLVGTWKLAPQAGALGVGPGLNDFGWWSNAIEDVTTRACLFDDLYVFNEDGTFENVLGSETWVEPWQGAAAEECGAPIFPHDGSATATYTYDPVAGTITIDGKGAFLGLAKVVNGAELASPSEAPDSVTYLAELTGNTLELDIAIAGDGYWSFTLVKE